MARHGTARRTRQLLKRQDNERHHADQQHHPDDCTQWCPPNGALQEALTIAGFSSLCCVADLGFVGWDPPARRQKGRGAPYSYKSLTKATAEEISQYVVSDKSPDSVVDVDILSQRLPISFLVNPSKQIVAQKFPYGRIAIAPLCHAQSRCDLSTLDFYFGCSALEILSAERKTGKGKLAPYYVMKVPGTQMIMLHYSLNYAQDYSVPGFQFERLVTGKDVGDRHDVGFVEHVQQFRIGEYNVLMTAEIDAIDADGNPAEVKLLKGGGGTKAFFQMVGSGSLRLYKGRNDKGVLKSLTVVKLETMAHTMAQNRDTALLEQKIIRNMERLKEWDRQRYFDDGKIYRVDFNPQMELHSISKHNSMLPPESIVKQLLSTNKDD